MTSDAVTPPRIVVEIVTTIDDQVRFNEHMRNRPQIRRRRHAIVLVCVLIGVAAGFLANSPVSHMRDDPASWWLPPIFAFLLTAGAFIGVITWSRALRPLLKWQIRRVLAQRPGIDPQDPDLREWCRCTFDAKGYSTEGKSTRMAVDWSVVQGLDEVDGLLILRTGDLQGFILPLRDISAADVQAIRAIVQAKVPGKAS